MVVVLVIAILLAIAISTFLGARKRAQGAQARTNLRSVASAVATARSADGVMPATTGALSALESSVAYTTAASTGPASVSTAFASDHVSFAVKDNSGRCWSSTVSDVGVTESPVPTGWTCVASLVVGPIGTSVVSTLGGTGAQSFGGDGGAVSAASFNNPMGMSTGSDGSVYVADSNNNVVRKIATNGVVTTIAGNGTAASTGDGGAATAAAINRPQDLAIDPTGRLVIADSNSNKVRRINTDGTITTIVGNGKIRTVVGTGTAGSSGLGGVGTQAQLNGPRRVAFDLAGNAYICEHTGNRVVKLTVGGMLTGLTGNGAATTTGNGGPASAATVNGAVALTFDWAGNLLVTEYAGQVIRKLTA